MLSRPSHGSLREATFALAVQVEGALARPSFVSSDDAGAHDLGDFLCVAGVFKGTHQLRLAAAPLNRDCESTP